MSVDGDGPGQGALPRQPDEGSEGPTIIRALDPDEHTLPVGSGRTRPSGGADPSEPAQSPAFDLDSHIPVEREGQYSRLGEIGRGGQSVVLRALDRYIGREVALKQLSVTEGGPDTDSSRAAEARFLREVRLVGGLDHPGIVSIHELARREDGTVFCAQKLIRGANLQLRLGKCRSLGDRLVLLRHVLDACQAVGFAHSKHVIHRDLKPSNIMVGEHGETVVVDWGLAKHREEPDDIVPLVPSSPEPELTIAGVALGTPAYMSPEQARGDLAAIDARSDVFSLGAILYQVLTGRPPFEGATLEQILENVRRGKFPRVQALASDAPPELAAIAERALRPEPAARYGDAEELARELSAYLAGGRVRAYQYGAWQLVRKFAASHRALTAGVAVALGALLVAGTLVAFRLHAARLDLARSSVDRAYAAERDADWAAAAAYFAAARTQHDSPEAQWGLAIASDRAPERSFFLNGPAGSFIDVGALPDGRIVALGLSSNRVEVRDLESGGTLWSLPIEPRNPIAYAALLPGGQVRLSVGGGWAFRDGATGRELGMHARSEGRPCPSPYPPAVFILRQRLVHRRAGAPDRVLATDVSPSERCVVSEDGHRVAYEGLDRRVHILAVDDGRALATHSPSGWTRDFQFSPHGLVLIQVGPLEVFGGPDGDFTIGLPGEVLERKYGIAGGREGQAVSPDGHLVVVSRLSSNRADVVDLRSRTIVGTIRHGPDWPRFAFSLDGRRVLAAGLNEGATLGAWRLAEPESPEGHPTTLNYEGFAFSSTGHRLLATTLEGSSDAARFRMYGANGEFVANGPKGYYDQFQDRKSVV